MRTPREIYAQYKIMPNLQLHQLRVAAVAKLICDHATTSVNAGNVVLECLFHDMGNIIKFDLAYFPEFLEPEGREYWESVKKDFLLKYGAEQHAATAAIAREIGLPTAVLDVMNASGFSRVRAITEGGSAELQICQYADMRVAPHGVVTLEERLQDFAVRYKGKDDAIHEDVLEASRALEQKIFSDSNIRPEDIHDVTVAPLVETLGEYPAVA